MSAPGLDGPKAAGAEAPAAWDEVAVRAALADALDTLRRWRRPGGLAPAGLVSTMPLPPGQGSRGREAPPPPSPKAIQRMEDRLHWLYWIEHPGRRKAVCLRALGLSWRRIAAAVGVASPETARAWEAAGVADVAGRLNAGDR
jgi:hypothetical protein